MDTKMSQTSQVAIMGATGAVGRELIELLEQRDLPLKSLKLLASKRSLGKKIAFRKQTLIVEELTHESFQQIDIVLASAGGKLSKKFVPSALKAGAVVIDNTSYFRMQKDVPLVIPEINAQEIKKHRGIIANPNCSTIILLLPLWVLHKINPIKRVVVSTYQAASGAGAQAMEELKQETAAVLEGKPFKRTVMAHPYAFNLFAHDSPMAENGYCQEENKMINETRKIFGEADFKLTATCVRVPVLRAHCESVNVAFTHAMDPQTIYKAWQQAEGIEVLEDRAHNRWPMPIDVSTKDAIYVGRLRKDVSQENTYEFWVAGDQLRKGAALNAVQIMERLLLE